MSCAAGWGRALSGCCGKRDRAVFVMLSGWLSMNSAAFLYAVCISGSLDVRGWGDGADISYQYCGYKPVPIPVLQL